MTTETEEEHVPDMAASPVEPSPGEAASPVEAFGFEGEETSPAAVVGEPETFSPVSDGPAPEEAEAPSPVAASSPSPMASPVLDLPEPEPQAHPEGNGKAWKAAPASGNQLHLEEKVREEAERKRELIQAGQAELEQMVREAEERSAKRRQAAIEESARREQEAASKNSLLLGSDLSKEESWTAVCELIDFKRDAKADLSSFKSLLIQLKHAT